ncbi:MAG: TolC family protein [Chitinophagaceae bacterium]
MKKNGCLLIIFFLLPAILFAQKNALDYYLNRALTNSPLLKDYQNQIQQNLIDSERIVASYKPQVTGNSVNTFAPTYNGFGYDYATTNGGNFAELISVNKTLVGSNHLNAQYETIRLQNQSLNNTSKISEQDLKRTIMAQYITTYGDLQQVNFNKQENELLKNEETVLKKLTVTNVYRQTDYLTFLVTLQQQDLTLRQLQIQFQNDFATLNYLCGIIDTATVSLEEPNIYLNNLPEISNSVFFQKYQIDSLQIINNKSLVNYSYKPKINLYADAGFNSTFAYQAYKNFGTSFGISLTVPIYDGRQRQMQLTKLDIQERTRNNYKDFFTMQYTQQIAQLMRQLHATESLIADINKQIKYSESLVQVNAKLMLTGDARITDYVLALNNYLTAKNLLTQNYISRMQIINQINYWNK